MNKLKALLFYLLLSSMSFAANSHEVTHKLVVFSGSDWCVHCIRLEKKVLSKTEFIDFAKENHIEVEVLDFPQRKKLDAKTQEYNKKMAEKHGFKGSFPTLFLVNQKTNKVTQVPPAHKVSTFINILQSKLATVSK